MHKSEPLRCQHYPYLQKKLKEEREKRIVGGFRDLLEEAEELEARLAEERDMGASLRD